MPLSLAVLCQGLIDRELIDRELIDSALYLNENNLLSIVRAIDNIFASDIDALAIVSPTGNVPCA